MLTIDSNASQPVSLAFSLGRSSIWATALLLVSLPGLPANRVLAQEYTTALRFALGTSLAAEAPLAEDQTNSTAAPPTTPETSLEKQPAAPQPTPKQPVGQTPAANADSKQTASKENKPSAPGEFSQSRLFAQKVRYEGDVIIAEGTATQPVRFESGTTRLQAQNVRIDVANKSVQAGGNVFVENTRDIEQSDLFERPDLSYLNSYRIYRRRPQGPMESVTETLRGSNFNFDWRTRQGRLDNATVRLASFNVDAGSLVINGDRYTARNVLLRPGGLTEAERKIYGTPPPNIRAKSVTVVAGQGRRARVIIKGAALYWNNQKILPVPSYVFSALNRGGSSRAPQTFTLTPRISFNSADSVLVTTRLQFPVAKDPDLLSLRADLGASAKVGFRGGIGLDSFT
ncbi:MAG: hypothetical protein M3347_17760, partial [Armatimonadota bacterium]|nr:hypothetical protein [Armatimonadota bacterium]